MFSKESGTKTDVTVSNTSGSSEQEGRERGRKLSLKFSVDVPFFADQPVKCGLFERSN